MSLLEGIHSPRDLDALSRDQLTQLADEIRTFLATRLSKWQLPDDVVFIDAIPKTSVGKFSKKTLRDRFADYVLPTG